MPELPSNFGSGSIYKRPASAPFHWLQQTYYRAIALVRVSVNSNTNNRAMALVRVSVSYPAPATHITVLMALVRVSVSYPAPAAHINVLWL